MVFHSYSSYSDKIHSRRLNESCLLQDCLFCAFGQIFPWMRHGYFSRLFRMFKMMMTACSFYQKPSIPSSSIFLITSLDELTWLFSPLYYNICFYICYMYYIDVFTENPFPQFIMQKGVMFISFRHFKRNVHHHLHTVDEAVFIHAELRMVVRVLHVLPGISHPDHRIGRRYQP